MSESLLKLLDGWGKPRILVIGDVILDRYVRGSVGRISPEAPIPVMLEHSRESKLGGAGAVVLNVLDFGADADFVSVTGDDDEAEIVRELVGKALGAGVYAVEVAGRLTTVKTRFIGNVQSAGRGLQHIMRLDREETSEVSRDHVEKMEALVRQKLPKADCVLLSDYDKGMFTPSFIKSCIMEARKNSIPVIVDPKRSEDYSIYKGATGITPNRFEARQATGIDTSEVDGCKRAAEKLVRQLELDWCAVTMDKDGHYLAMSDGKGKHISTTPRNVFDVSGAGDMVLATFGMAISCGNSPFEAARLANVSAGVEVGKIGVATVTKQEMRSALISQHPGMSEKLKNAENIQGVLEEHRRRGEIIVMTNGCFDVLHAGHVQFLSQAKAQGDVLVVALNTDRSVKELKGPERPVNDEKMRAKVLSALGDVDYIIHFDENTPEKIVRVIRPDKLVKGEDWRDKGVVGRDFVESYGGEVVLVPLVDGLSTTDTINKIRKTSR